MDNLLSLNGQLFAAALAGDLRRLQAWLGAGVDPSAQLDQVEYLLTRCRRRKRGALHVAAEGGHAGCVAALLAAGARPSAADSGGFTAVHAAATTGH
ncbi:hypothetical protein ABPG75_009201 [Micractinium tetrahymenae]